MEGGSSEAPLPPAEKKEKEPITEEQCLDAMKSGHFELVQEWYAQEEKRSEADTTAASHIDLMLRMAKLQRAAGLKEYAKETLEMAHWDAMGQEDYEVARNIEDILDAMKKS